jgi:hypothetical protein
MVLSQSCDKCTLKNGSYVTAIPVTPGLGFRTIYVDVLDIYTKARATALFAVSVSPADIIATNNDTNRRLIENVTAQNARLQASRGAQQYTFFGVVLFFAVALELRRSYRGAKDFNMETWVDRVKRPFGARKSPLSKVVGSSEPMYAGASEQMRRQVIRHNKRILGSALRDNIELLEILKSMKIHEEEVTKTIQASRVALGLPPEPGLPGLTLKQFGTTVAPQRRSPSTGAADGGSES